MKTYYYDDRETCLASTVLNTETHSIVPREDARDDFNTHTHTHICVLLVHAHGHWHNILYIDIFIYIFFLIYKDRDPGGVVEATKSITFRSFE